MDFTFWISLGPAVRAQIQAVRVPPGATVQRRQGQIYREDCARHTVSLGTSQLKRTSVPREDLLGDPKPEASFTKSLGGEKWFEIWIAVPEIRDGPSRRLDHWRRVLIPFRREIRSWMYCRNFNGMALISSAVGYIAAECGAAL
jgi:hypothetical protein